MIINKSIVLLLIVMFNFSCTDKKDRDWDDNIKLSQKEFQFDAVQNSVDITTEGDSWWVSEILFKDGKTFDLSNIDNISKNFIITESEFTLERKDGKEISI